MRTKVRNRVFFIQLDENIFQRLKKEVVRNNTIYSKGENHLKLDLACFFINLIDKRRTLLGDEAENGFVPLMSEILKKYYFDYKRYIGFLKEKDFIEVIDGYSTFLGKSKQYKIIPAEEPSNLIQYIPKDSGISRKIQKIEMQERARADRSCGHLTKWLHPQFLSINAPEAHKKIDELMSQGYYSDGHYEKRKHKIDLLDIGYISYKREGKDNRLHSILTNLPKDLRPYLSFRQNKQLISLDLKSSQPFMLAGFINMVLEKKATNIDLAISSVLGSRRRKDIRDIIIMWQENLSAVDIAELKSYIKIVLKDDIYDYIGRNLSPEFLQKRSRSRAIKDKFYSKSLKNKKVKFFKNSRDFSKVALLEYLYSSENNHGERLKEVKKIVPTAVNKFVKLMKRNFKEDFPIFLQNLESFLIIDLITKKFSKEYPEAPLYTIHDSVATTEEFVLPLQDMIQKELLDFFGIKPNVVPEVWIEDSSEAA